MKKTLLALLIFLLISTLAALDVTPKQLIFKTSKSMQLTRDGRTGLSTFDSYLNSLAAYPIKAIAGMPNNQYFLVNLENEPNWEEIKAGRLEFAGIEYVQPNYLNKMHLEPNDALYSQLYHYVVSCPQAWNITTGSEQVLVAVVDSGLLLEHPDLKANIYINPNEIPDNGIDDDGNGYIDDWIGWDFVDAPELADIALGDYVGQDNDPSDENYHGTHVAGIIGAVGNNGIGVCGVNWNVKLLATRAGFRTTTGDGYLQDDDAAAAVIYAADMGAHVINMSWGDDNYSPIIADACQYAYDKGSVLVASAGNTPMPLLSYPAKLSTTISVGAVNRNRNLAGFSSFGPDLDLVAPGEEVLSTYMLEAPNQYTRMNGTSMAAPYVSGAVALLLSLYPGLSPQEVRARLLNSCDDLGTPGYDMYYGHGLPNMRKLLESVNPPLINVSSPVEMQSVSEGFDIMGTIQAEDFFRYSVMYAIKDVPATIVDWLDVQYHTNLPNYMTNPVENGVLAQFYIPEYFAEKTYLVRVQYENRQGKKYNHYFNFRYDRTAPKMKTGSLQGHFRYDGQNKRFYVTAAFDEKVLAQLKVRDSLGQISHCYNAIEDSLVFWPLPSTVAPGMISVQVLAHNASGLSFESPEMVNFMDVSYELIDNYGYEYEIIGPARVALTQLYDFDSDGALEYMGMSLPQSGYGNVQTYQAGAGAHVVTHNFEDNFWPLGVKKGINDKAEILYTRGDTAFLAMCQTEENYPNLNFWQENAVAAGVFADYNGDGIKDMLLIRNLATEQVIQAYKRGQGIEVIAKNILRNTSSTSLRNTFVPTIIVENLDQDHYPDILCADTDGDVMIFEIKGDQVSELSWQHRLPAKNTYTLTVGDFDGDGKKDFFIGGYTTDVVNPHRNYWYFEGFKNTGNDSYASMGNLFFNNVMQQNAINCVDVDGDGKDEIILGISPNLYIIKYIEGKFKPIFKGESMRGYNILTFKDANDKVYFATNKSIDDTLYFVQYTASEPFTGPPTPMNLIAEPLNENSVALFWLDNSADSYRIYRKDENGDVSLVCETPLSVYLDNDLIEGHTYQYCVRAVNNSYDPPESKATDWVKATPLPQPQVQSIEMVSASEIKLIFNLVMAADIVNPGRYTLNHDMGHPISANSIASQKGVLLRFRNALPATNQAYILKAENLRGVTGVLSLDHTFTFSYAPDTQAPMVDKVQIGKNHKWAKIIFNEPIASLPNPNYLGNYRFFPTVNDPENKIIQVQHENDAIIVSFDHALKTSNQPYHIYIENIQDLAGNTISPQHRTARISLTDTKDLSALKVYPNPVYTSKQNWVAIHNFPMNKKGNIRIYDSSGNLVHKATLGPFKAELGNNIFRWDLNNPGGHKVSSGVYFYVAEMDGEIAKGKIMILR